MTPLPEIGKVSLRPAKDAAQRDLSPGHPGRLLAEGLPDEMDVAAFDAIFPTLVRLLRQRCE